MIPRSKTIVDEGTVVVELIYTSIADGAVETGFRFDHFVVDT